MCVFFDSTTKVCAPKKCHVTHLHTQCEWGYVSFLVHGSTDILFCSINLAIGPSVDKAVQSKSKNIQGNCCIKNYYVVSFYSAPFFNRMGRYLYKPPKFSFSVPCRVNVWSGCVFFNIFLLNNPPKFSVCILFLFGLGVFSLPQYEMAFLCFVNTHISLFHTMPG